VRFGATGDGQPAIGVALHANGGLVELTVSDNGPGFEPDFDVVKRASGLGLVRALARQLGGALSIDRTTGTRATVVFSDRRLAAEEAGVAADARRSRSAP